MTHNFNLIN